VRLIYYKPGERASANRPPCFTSRVSDANLALARSEEIRPPAIIFKRNLPMREASMADGQFDKDFGYLMPFLDKVAAAANNLSETAARDELARLMSDEKTRWARIRQLLSGSQGQAVAPSAQSQSKPEPTGGSQAATETPIPREAFSFTVGSLRPRKATDKS
jgi:hypothetical protein